MSSEVTVEWVVGGERYAVTLAGEWVPPLVVPVDDAPPYRWDSTGLRRLSEALPGLVRQAEEHLADLAAGSGFTGRSDEGVWEVLPGYRDAPVAVHEDDGALRDAVEVARLVGEAHARGVPVTPFVWEALSRTEVVSLEAADKRVQRARERGVLSPRVSPRVSGPDGDEGR
jgi:hypothetical protein